jgi:predicted nucleotidyltransferase
MQNIHQYKFLKKLALLPYVEEIWLYGSRAREDNRERSDIDIAIICPSATDADWHVILSIVDTADTLLNIDCVRFDNLKEDDPFRLQILKDKKVLYKQDN